MNEGHKPDHREVDATNHCKLGGPLQNGDSSLEAARGGATKRSRDFAVFVVVGFGFVFIYFLAQTAFPEPQGDGGGWVG